MHDCLKKFFVHNLLRIGSDAFEEQLDDTMVILCLCTHNKVFSYFMAAQSMKDFFFVSTMQQDFPLHTLNVLQA